MLYAVDGNTENLLLCIITSVLPAVLITLF